MKFLPSPTARKFELELFKFCKLNEEAQTANAGVLLWELEKMGITREDARMKPIIEILRRLRRFLPDPGVSGVRSMGPGVSIYVTDLWLRLC